MTVLARAGVLLFACALALVATFGTASAQGARAPVHAGPAPLVASGAPTWIWATLVMVGFVGLTLLTMALARTPVRRAPPPLDAPEETPGRPGEGDGRGGDAPMSASEDWEVVRVAPDQITAEMWVALLREEGVPALIKPSDAVSFMGTSGLSCRVLVPKDRLADAGALLDERTGSGPNTES